MYWFFYCNLGWPVFSWQGEWYCRVIFLPLLGRSSVLKLRQWDCDPALRLGPAARTVAGEAGSAELFHPVMKAIIYSTPHLSRHHYPDTGISQSQKSKIAGLLLFICPRYLILSKHKPIWGVYMYGTISFIWMSWDNISRHPDKWGCTIHVNTSLNH